MLSPKVEKGKEIIELGKISSHDYPQKKMQRYDGKCEIFNSCKKHFVSKLVICVSVCSNKFLIRSMLLLKEMTFALDNFCIIYACKITFWHKTSRI